MRYTPCRNGDLSEQWGGAGRTAVATWIDSKTVGGVTELTLLTPIKRGLIPGEARTYEQRLASHLSTVQRRIEDNIPNPIGRLAMIHFARWQILLPDHYLHYDQAARVEGHQYQSWLLFTSNFDGDLKVYLNEFSAFIADDVDRIWGNCEGYPPGGSRDFDAYWAYAKKHQITTQAYFNAYPGLTVPRIHELVAFRRMFDEFVAETRRPDGSSIEGLPAAFDRFLARALAFPQNFPARGGVFDAPSDR
jgi:hypothetical protein